MISFTYPIIVIFAPIIVIIWYVFLRERIGTVYPNSIIVKHLKTPKSIWVLWIIRALIITSLVSILAGPKINQTIITKEKVPQDIMIVFDISLSMLAEDILPSRIAVARNVVNTFISKRIGDRIGLIIFAGKPFVSIPFSTDYSGIKNIVSGLSPQLIRQDLPGLSGTNIGDALLLANMTYSGSLSLARSIILITDGRANIGIDPLVATDESHSENIRIYPIGIGSINGSNLFYTNSYGKKSYFYDVDGNILQSDLDESMMQKIATQSNGQYFHANDRIGLEKVFADISKSIPDIRVENKKIQSMDLTPVLLIFSIFLLIGERMYVWKIMRKYRLI